MRPVYGAQYPPLKGSDTAAAAAAAVAGSARRPSADADAITGGSARRFDEYNESVDDAWRLEDSSAGAGALDAGAARASAATVLARHAAANRVDPLMPNLHALPSKHNREQALRRLAMQREPVPGAAVPAGGGAGALYPRLPELNTEPAVSSKYLVASSSSSSAAATSKGATAPAEKSADVVRFARLAALLADDAAAPVDSDALRRDCWRGVPHTLRPTAWRLLSGYLPSNPERRQSTLERKRAEYFNYVEQYFHTRHDDHFQDTFRQIHIDIPRMCPLVPLFQQKVIQEIFERILYIWSVRHPASGYVQGINDLVTPFFVVFLSEFVTEDAEVGTYDVSQLKRESLDVIEADSFWCVTALLDTIQDNYTFAQTGIQKKIVQLQNLMSRVDSALHTHLQSHGIEYLQFTFRWMNNILMREIPLRATVRLWDTYLSEKNGFADFHVYVCAAFLRMWSKQLRSQKDFQNIMLLLQNLPTQSWSDQQICELTADAYSLMCLFSGAKNHLLSGN